MFYKISYPKLTASAAVAIEADLHLMLYLHQIDLLQ